MTEEYVFKEARNKDEMMENIQAGYGYVEKMIQSLTPEMMNEPGPDGGWSIKDHLAHLAVWRRKLLADLQERPDWIGLGLTEEEAKNNETDGINALIYQRWHERSLDDVLDTLKTAQEAVVYQLNKTSEEDLVRERTGSSGQPYHLYELVNGNTYGHDQEHLEWIGELLKKRQSGAANLG